MLDVGDDDLAAYRQLVEVAEHELALVSAGHWDELTRAQEAWAQTLAGLPAQPPQAAEPLLRRALALAAQTEQRIVVARDGVLRELSGVEDRRAAGRAYAPAPATAPVSALNLSA